MKSIGKLIYEPSSHLGNTRNWLVLMCDDQISDYYRKLYTMAYPPYLNGGYPIKLARPVFGAHISVIRGEHIHNYHLWKLDNNKIVEFEYESGVKNNGEYYWLDVICPYLENLRSQYGLNKQPKYGFHLTIGRITKN